MLKVKALGALVLGTLALATSVPANAGYVQIYRDNGGYGYQLGNIIYCEDDYTVAQVNGIVSGPGIAPAEKFWWDTWELYGC